MILSAPDDNNLAAQFVALNETLRAQAGDTDALQRLVELAVSTVPGCDASAITTWPGHRDPASVAVSGDEAAEADRLQYTSGEGPCLSAASEDEAVRSADLRSETRWPTFCEAVLAQTAVRGVMSFHLGDEPYRSALNLYSNTPGAFDADALAPAALFAAHARVLVIHVASRDKAANLEIALTTSRQIGTAIGILMNARKITADSAFELLRASSQTLHRKLRDIADDVNRMGTLPSAGSTS